MAMTGAMSLPSLLILGRSGQVSRALAAAAMGRFAVRALGRDALDLARVDTIAPALDAARPAVVINAAAYTAVDLAESERDAAFLLNRDAPAAMAEACARLGAPLLHISTDFVFDGQGGAPYAETAPVSPLSVYGASKAAGEAAVLQSEARACVVRTSWVYDATGKNFVRTMLRLAGERDEVRVVADQRGRPTYAADLASALLTLAEALLDRDAQATGLMHFANSGEAVWADLAEAAIQGAAKRGARATPVVRITTDAYPTPARRPADSRLDLSRYERFAGAAPPEWRGALERCLNEMFP
jgi:dTDP-4-dehydrorhamnose reductase